VDALPDPRTEIIRLNPTSIEVNGRKYDWPKNPVVVICVDGCEPAYLDEAIAAGHMPWLAKAVDSGARFEADCVVPSFTNPNNLSIVTGVPPAVHGISGNYFLDPDSGEAVMMNEPRFLRAPTLFAAFADAGAHITVITAKDKLRKLLGHGLAIEAGGHVCFSSEKADEASTAENGIDGVLDFVGLPLPSVYSAALSEFVLAAGVKLLKRDRPELMYLSTTDYVQHKSAPGATEANSFYAMLDRHMAALDAGGATVVMTADHGMNAKHGEDGLPNVIYLQDHLDNWALADTTRVILPITDPYVVHHGALGSFATVYVEDGADCADVAAKLSALTGVESVLSREEAAGRFELPPERLGDLVVVSLRHHVLGTRASEHDLSGLEVPLRSHGGVSEQRVPLILNKPIQNLPNRDSLRNFDAFALALNHT
jgi:phosphonoacetate hydrolase